MGPLLSERSQRDESDKQFSLKEQYYSLSYKRPFFQLCYFQDIIIDQIIYIIASMMY